MQTNWKTRLATFLAHVNILAVKSGAPPGKLIELDRKEAYNYGHRDPDFLGEPVGLDLSLSLGGRNSDPPPMIPRWTSSEIYRLGDSNQANMIGHQALTEGLETQNEFQPGSSSNVQARETDFFGISKKRQLNFHQSEEPFAPRNLHLHSNQHESTVEPVQYNSQIEHSPGPQLQLSLSLNPPEVFPKRQKLFGVTLEAPTINPDKNFVPHQSFDTPQFQMLVTPPAVNHKICVHDEALHKMEQGHSLSVSSNDPRSVRPMLSQSGENLRKSEQKSTEEVIFTPLNIHGGQDGNSKLNVNQRKPDDYNKNKDPNKFWAMICGSILCVAKSDEQKLKSENMTKISKFFQSLWPKIHEIIKAECFPMGRVEKIPNFGQFLFQFSDLIWLINLRFLKSLGNLSPEGYLEETDLVHNWFLGILEKRQESIKIGGPSQNIEDRENEANLEEMIEIISEYFSLEDKPQKIYIIQKRRAKHKKKIGVISERQSLITEAVTKLLAYYYRSNYPDKWGKIFSAEGSFFLHISRINFEKLYIENIVEDMEKVDPLLSLTILPWKNPLKHNTSAIEELLEPFKKRLYSVLDWYVEDIKIQNIHIT
ncbi:hypothetical protein PGT21_003388 [Puccinia graminis f. sp. tritici]|uniref:Uncharacterized protein n=1 Tax=Puccinia graminis f. sp. tritici TaxID=56615 RepID=A0A5B0LXL3_PUCGR|nr:hypothetical protein PGT21_003388 [Puccinia graminis f. sp. tritici]